MRVAIVGAGGYGGVGAIEILVRHPRAEITRLIDVGGVGEPISAQYPHLKGHCDVKITSADDKSRFEKVDIVFFATPDGVGQKAAGDWLSRGVKVIDYSGDFRFSDAATYAGYATRIGKTTEHTAAGLLARSAYGIPELHRKRIAKASVVGNPGCFAVACILGLAPAVKGKLFDLRHIVCDCKTGVSGAGKNPAPGFHYPARYECTNAYRVGAHQHIYEIERELSLQAGRSLRVTFTPHVVPMTRGIVATLYAPLRGSPKRLLATYKAFYRNEAFVRVLGPGESTKSTDVRGSNYVNIWINHDERTKKAVIVSHIDNLVKGQAGSAVQNMNVMMGLPETIGLDQPGAYP